MRLLTALSLLVPNVPHIQHLQWQDECTLLAAAQLAYFSCVVTFNVLRALCLAELCKRFGSSVLAILVQVKDIDLSKESPCGHGFVTCFSIYGGTVDNEVCNFAADKNAPCQDQLWVDTMLDGNEASRRRCAPECKQLLSTCA